MATIHTFDRYGVVLDLNEYEVANLRWALKQITEGSDRHIRNLDTGDWVHQIYNVLEKARID